MRFNDLLVVLHKLPNVPLGCKEATEEEHQDLDVGEQILLCQLQPDCIGASLRQIAWDLDVLNQEMLAKAFEKGAQGSG